jgi:hypothetical protein
MRAPEVGTTLGKCVFDSNIITEGSGIRSDHATLRHGRWICGECLLGLREESFVAFLDQCKLQDKEASELLRKVKKYGWVVNPETGKLEKL